MKFKRLKQNSKEKGIIVGKGDKYLIFEDRIVELFDAVREKALKLKSLMWASYLRPEIILEQYFKAKISGGVL